MKRWISRCLMLAAYVASIAAAGMYQSQMVSAQTQQPAKPGKGQFISGVFICDCTQPVRDCYCIGSGS